MNTKRRNNIIYILNLIVFAIIFVVICKDYVGKVCTIFAWSIAWMLEIALLERPEPTHWIEDDYD